MATLSEIWFPVFSAFTRKVLFFFNFFFLFYLESTLLTLSFLFIVNAMNVQYDAILAKIIRGVIVPMFRCVLVNRFSQ